MELAKPNASEAAQPPGAPTGAAEATGGGSSGSDSLVIHPYVFPAPLKAPLLGKLKKLSQHLNGGKEGAAYLQALESARSQLGAGERRRRFAARRTSLKPDESRCRF